MIKLESDELMLIKLFICQKKTSLWWKWCSPRELSGTITLKSSEKWKTQQKLQTKKLVDFLLKLQKALAAKSSNQSLNTFCSLSAVNASRSDKISFALKQSSKAKFSIWSFSFYFTWQQQNIKTSSRRSTIASRIGNSRKHDSFVSCNCDCSQIGHCPEKSMKIDCN